MRDRLPFDRDSLVDIGFDSSVEWDLIVIGGGATGLGTAIDAASRGYRTLLLEQHDFGKGTSSRSTKLIHGGVRYLRQGNISLVIEALRERGCLLKNAPHLVHTVPFVIPCYRRWERPYYGFGLKLYQAMSGRLSIGPSSILSRDVALDFLPNAAGKAMRGGVLYHDAQFDDSRLIINLAQTCADLGAVPLNYVRVTGLLRRGGRIRGVIARDVEGGREVELEARVVVNATGVFVDGVRRMDDPQCPAIIRPSQGIHIVIGRRFLPGDAAMMIPRTDDGRVLFVIPWRDRTILGTTDTPVESIDVEPEARSSEVDFLLEHVAQYLEVAPERQDVLSIFAGLRPLVASGRTGDTKAISRDHVLRVSSSGLVTITGGKWTTYRKMAQDAVDHAAKVAGLDQQPSRTHSLAIHGARISDGFGLSNSYGADAPAVQDAMAREPGGTVLINEKLPVRRGEVSYLVRREMARTVEDVLARRTRSLLMDAGASIEAAPEVAQIMAAALGRNRHWQEEQVEAYRTVARNYLPDQITVHHHRAVDMKRGARQHYDTA